MARKKKKMDSDVFANIAYRNGTTYAEMQKQETINLMEPVRVPPKGYTKIGDRIKNKTGE